MATTFLAKREANVKAEFNGVEINALSAERLLKKIISNRADFPLCELTALFSIG
ncbi:MAG: hypothetical protein IPL32_15160 [Chloracidobacterium sp.]|nr:hypothetical protein [Chloracidobacterium sp.]